MQTEEDTALDNVFFIVLWLLDSAVISVSRCGDAPNGSLERSAIVVEAVPDLLLAPAAAGQTAAAELRVEPTEVRQLHRNAIGIAESDAVDALLMDWQAVE